MVKITPQLYSNGRFTVTPPFKINSSMNYTCIALRSFEDLYKAGFEVYDSFYASVGLTLDSGFDFEAEKLNGPNIISLRGDDGSVIYLPDTYISSIPSTGDVTYRQVIVACSLGMLPTSLDLNILLNDVSDFIGARIGHVVESKLITTPSYIQPTTVEHEVLQTARESAITVKDNLTTKNIELKKLNEELVKKNETLITVLKNNNLLKGV